MTWPKIIDATAAIGRYPHRTERLWFLDWDGKIFAVMARTSDAAVCDVKYSRIHPNAVYMSGLQLQNKDERPLTRAELLIGYRTLDDLA